MAYDGIFLYSVIEELKETIVNSKIDKINQPEKDEIILTFRGNRKLLLTASSSYPRIHMTAFSKPNPNKAPSFCMLLRKYLIGARLLEIEQVSTDRIVKLKFESTDELGFNSIYYLICEIMGRHSNISLVRARDNKLMDSIKHITPDINSYRTLLPGLTYVYPPASDKLNPTSFSEAEFKNAVLNLDINENSFAKIFTGVSKSTSSALFYKVKDSNDLFQALNSYFKDIFVNHNFSFAIYEDKGTFKDFHCIPLTSYNEKILFDSPSLLLDEYYSKKDKQDRLHSRTLDLQKLIHTNIDRISKKLVILKDSLDECSTKEDFKIKGELLTANIYSIKQGMKSIDVLNYYSPDGETISIALDENKSPSENAQRYFNKYGKLKKTEAAAIDQIEKANEELDYLNSVLTSINNLENYDEINDIRKELADSGYIRHGKLNKQKVKPSKPMHFLSSAGIDIYVGKNNIQNDYLTLKFADKIDTWMHTKNIPGSHVIIRAKYIDEATLMEGATLAAYYSKAQNSTNVPIDYTEVRNVKKPSHSKPGMVIYYTNKTLYVTPKELNLKRIE
ncbi:NFACT family protein [Clostridium cadaveris]|uniref:Rqc2 family fibronectin-binding protein n=1 Tax=Clostridium cadaveris TaxID=1529 RepID=UPI001E5655BF|nr:NFACT RNA binding domain-containing protein [Clostridium cadaveris]UFH63475.1 NFACT family protein [Clostridium cadaveris]